MISDFKELLVGFRWKVLCLSFWRSLVCDLTWVPRTISSLQGLQKEGLCSLLISCPLSVLPSFLFSFQWCFMPLLQPRSNGSCTAPPLSCRPVATSRLLVLTMEKSASTTIGKWSQRKAGQKVAIKLIVSNVQQELRLAHPIIQAMWSSGCRLIQMGPLCWA